MTLDDPTSPHAEAGAPPPVIQPTGPPIGAQGPYETSPELNQAAPLHARSVGPAADPVRLAHRCAAHRYHQPVPRYLEEHHVVPRAWQAAWRPPDAGDAPVWHPETVLLCRDGHGNVHYWIEVFMQQLREGETPEEVARRVLGRAKDVGRQEHVIARRALEEWVSYGGGLAFLATRHLYGGLYGGNTDISS